MPVDFFLMFVKVVNVSEKIYFVILRRILAHSL